MSPSGTVTCSHPSWAGRSVPGPCREQIFSGFSQGRQPGPDALQYWASSLPALSPSTSHQVPSSPCTRGCCPSSPCMHPTPVLLASSALMRLSPALLLGAAPPPQDLLTLSSSCWNDLVVGLSRGYRLLGGPFSQSSAHILCLPLLPHLLLHPHSLA